MIKMIKMYKINYHLIRSRFKNNLKFKNTRINKNKMLNQLLRLGDKKKVIFRIKVHNVTQLIKTTFILKFMVFLINYQPVAVKQTN